MSFRCGHCNASPYEGSDGVVADWAERLGVRSYNPIRAVLERVEAAIGPLDTGLAARYGREVVERDVVWTETEDGEPACSGHCLEQLQRCGECGLRRADPNHQGCARAVEPCREHGADVLPIARVVDR